MTLAFAIAFAVGFLVVGVSFVGVALDRLRARTLAAAAGLLAAAAAVAAGAAAVNVLVRFTETRPLALGAAGLAAAAVAEAGLAALVRGLRRVREVDDVVAAAQARLAEFLEAHAKERAVELERTLAQEQANAVHRLSTQERRLAEERRDLIARQADRARAELTEAVASVQERLERRLAAWAADLDRGQRELERQLGDLAQRQREAIAGHEARLAADTERLTSAADDQSTALVQLRADLERRGAQLREDWKAELEVYDGERKRALHEVIDRLRVRERELRDQVEREEAESRARLGAGLVEVERRQLEQLERTLERATGRLVEEAERRFDHQIRQSREKAAARLSRELERAVEQFARAAEKQVADRVAEIGQATLERLERRLDALAREAEAGQRELLTEAVRTIGERVEGAVAEGESHLAALEAQLEIEIARKLAELERSLRALDTERA